jgi:RND family efflux transporter MFP subunit
MKRLRWPILLGIFVLVAASYFYLNAASRGLPVWLGGDGAIAVRIAPVRKLTAPLRRRLMGQLAALKETAIVSPLAGRVAEVRFNAGDAVRAGAIVATIHSSALAQRIAEFEAAVGAARQESQLQQDQLAAAETQVAKTRTLQQQDLIARRDLEQAQTAAEAARAQAEFARAHLAQQEAMLAQARALQNLTRLSAPFSGVVSRRLAEPGAAVAEFGPILTLADVDSLKMTARVVGITSSDIRVGMTAEISSPAAPGKTLVGKVVGVEPSTTGDGQRGSEVEIHTGVTQGNFHPGTAAEAVINLEKQQETFWLPRSAVLSAAGKSYVYKFAGGRALRQEIALGAVRNGDVEVMQGINDGDAVIIDQLNSLKPGSRVRPLNALEPRAAQ